MLSNGWIVDAVVCGRSRGEIECSEMHVAIQGAYTDVMLGEYGLATNLKSTILVFKKKKIIKFNLLLVVYNKE